MLLLKGLECISATYYVVLMGGNISLVFRELSFIEYLLSLWPPLLVRIMHNEPLIKARIQQAAALVAQAEAIVVSAGAGIGVDSGMPDLRSENGFWKAYPALAQGRMTPIQKIASKHSNLCTNAYF